MSSQVEFDLELESTRPDLATFSGLLKTRFNQLYLNIEEKIDNYCNIAKNIFRRDVPDRNEYENLDAKPSKWQDFIKVLSQTKGFFQNWINRLLIGFGIIFALVEGLGPSITAMLTGNITKSFMEVSEKGFQTEEQSKYLPCNCDEPGKSIEQILKDRPKYSPNQFKSEVVDHSRLFLYIGLVVFAAYYLKTFCWNKLADRFSLKINSLIQTEIRIIKQSLSSHGLTTESDDSTPRSQSGLIVSNRSDLPGLLASWDISDNNLITEVRIPVRLEERIYEQTTYSGSQEFLKKGLTNSYNENIAGNLEFPQFSVKKIDCKSYVDGLSVSNFHQDSYQNPIHESDLNHVERNQELLSLLDSHKLSTKYIHDDEENHDNGRSIGGRNYIKDDKIQTDPNDSFDHASIGSKQPINQLKPMSDLKSFFSNPFGNGKTDNDIEEPGNDDTKSHDYSKENIKGTKYLDDGLLTNDLFDDPDRNDNPILDDDILKSLDIDEEDSRALDEMGDIAKQMSQMFTNFWLSFSKSTHLSSVLVVAIPLISTLAYYSYKQTIKANKKSVIFKDEELENQTDTSTIDQDSIFTALGGEGNQIQQYQDHIHELKRCTIKKRIKLSITQSALILIIHIFAALFLNIAIDLMITKRLDFSSIIAVIMALVSASFAIFSLILSIKRTSKSFKHLSNKFSSIMKLRTPENHDSHSIDLKLIPQATNIQFANITLTDPDDFFIKKLHRFNLDINDGETVVIYDPSGWFRGVMSELMTRLIEPDSGLIMLDSIDLRDINYNWINNNVGSVCIKLLINQPETSILKFIRTGIQGQSGKQIDEKSAKKAAKIVGVDHIIEALPDGYETKIFKQDDRLPKDILYRLLLARIILKDPKIFVLEEFAEFINEEDLQTMLTKLRKGRTTIVVAHEPVEILNCHKIVFMMSGYIVEMGTYKQLIENQGKFYEFISNKKLRKEQDSNATKIDSSKISDAQMASLFDQIDSTSHCISIERKITTVTEKITESEVETLELSHTIGKKYTTTLEQLSWLQNFDALSITMQLSTLSNFILLFRPEWFPLLITLILSSILGMLGPIVGLVFANIVGSESFDIDFLKIHKTIWVAQIIFVGCIISLLIIVRSIILSWAIETAEARMRLICFSIIIRDGNKSSKSSDQISPGLQTSKLMENISHISWLMSLSVTTLTLSISMMISSFFLTLNMGFYFTVLIIVVIPLLFYAMKNQRRKNLSKKNKSKLVESQDEFVKISLWNNIKLKFGLIMRIFEKFSLAWILSLFIPLIPSFCAMITFNWGSHLIGSGLLTTIDMYRIIIIIGLTSISIWILSTIFLRDDASDLIEAIGTIAKLLKKQASSKLVGKNLRPVLMGSIQISRLNFSYPEKPFISVLKSINLIIKPGETLALIGPAKGGKSTLAGLIVRYNEINSGCIRIDDYDIRSIDVVYLRQKIALISDKPNVFRISLKDNITYGLKGHNHSMDKIMRAAQDAGLSDYVNSLPRGYDSIVGIDLSYEDLGMLTSKKLELARAIIRKPDIYLLDDPTRGLTKSDSLIFCDILERTTAGKTRIIITNDASTVKRADTIAIIRRGTLVGVGSHDELVSTRNMHYRKFLQEQLTQTDPL